ncbi:hypothetical protein ACHWQZ_G012704 [Mnemiopsis leidyi]
MECDDGMPICSGETFRQNENTDSSMEKVLPVVYKVLLTCSSFPVLKEYYKPIFVEYTGIVDAKVDYSCGDLCTVEQRGSGSCKTCDEDDCNAITTADDFMCDDYLFKDTVYTKKTDQATCKRLYGTDAKCKKPGDNATTADSFISPCGVCSKTELDADTCKDVRVVDSKSEDLAKNADSSSSSVVVVLSAFLGLVAICNTL